MSSFSKTIAVSLASKYKKDAGVLLKDRMDGIIDKEAKKLLQAYSKPVQDAVLDAVKGLGDNFAKGIVNPEYAPLSGRDKEKKGRHTGYYAEKLAFHPRFANKFWRYTGYTSNNFTPYKNAYLSKLKNSRPSYQVIKKQSIGKGLKVTIRLNSNVPKWSDEGLHNFLMGKFYPNTSFSSKRIPSDLKTLAFNEEGAPLRRFRAENTAYGAQAGDMVSGRNPLPARPFINKFMAGRYKLLEAKIARFIK